MRMIGKRAPSWRSPAYVNGVEEVVSSEDLLGGWYVLYWYPMDFTFVCPTEIRGFQQLFREFRSDNIAVIGASTDSFYSHRAWFTDARTFSDPITHPILADTNHSVSRAFSVLQEESGSSYRATVIVDDQAIIRSMTINDMSVGRSPREVLRTVQALQSGGLCGADWRKGEDFVG